ncbi:hypothetical protein BN14_09744 [Rhizoctonia solani AG-1 IB]|uniref:Uncharacterized protein n=1 Tax=Thanatephorus cucumeris (strain AG1-IB / isolate 7/3/14) TaxID=1108050 RepID=M5C871_THACB|nr:hypothetical protein BN14_09744 [Rhizoctonia solani AG-1 IB]
MPTARRMRHYPSPPVAYSDKSSEEINPKAYFACFDQVWLVERDQFAYGNWITIQLKPTDKGKINTRLVFKAYKRIYGPLGPSIDDHTWVELVSEDLVKFLRSQRALKGVDGLNQSPPGVDARDIFLRLETLKAPATKPEPEPEEEELVAPPTRPPHRTETRAIS